MSKNKKKVKDNIAALEAAKKNILAKEGTKEGDSKATTKVAGDQPKVDNKVEGKDKTPPPTPTPTPNPKKEEVKKDVAPKKEKKEQPKAPASKQEEKPKQEKIKTVKAEVVKDPVIKNKVVAAVTGNVEQQQIAIGSNRSSFDAKANFAYVIQKRYCENQEMLKNQPALCAAMAENLDVVMVLGLVDLRNELIERANSGELLLTMNPDAILHFKGVADVLGIQLAPTKLLENGQLQLNFTESKMPDALQEKTEAEYPEGKAITREEAGLAPANQPEYVPNLDPAAITTDDQLKEVLEYLATKSDDKRIVVNNLINAAEWYRNYRKAKETDTKLIPVIESMSFINLLNNIFEIISPTKMLMGLGSSVCVYASHTGGPVMSHAILHKYMSPKGYSEDDTKALLEMITQTKFRSNLEKNPELKIQDDKAIAALLGNKGIEYVEEAFNNETPWSKSVLGCVRDSYFPGKEVSKDELRMKIGQIINLYRDPMDRIEEFMNDVIPDTDSKEPAPAKEVEKKN